MLRLGAHFNGRGRVFRSFERIFTGAADLSPYAVPLSRHLVEGELVGAALGDGHAVDSLRKPASIEAKALATQPLDAVALGGAAQLLRGHDAEARRTHGGLPCLEDEDEVGRANRATELLNTLKIRVLADATLGPEGRCATSSRRAVGHRLACPLTSCRSRPSGDDGPCGGGSREPSGHRPTPCGRGIHECEDDERCAADRCVSWVSRCRVDDGEPEVAPCALHRVIVAIVSGGRERSTVFSHRQALAPQPVPPPSSRSLPLY